MAQQHGTTLEQALTNYTAMEQKLRRDVIGGLDIIVNNLGLTDPQTGQRIGLRDIAYHVAKRSPEQLSKCSRATSSTRRTTDRRTAPGNYGLETGPAADAYSAAVHLHAVRGRSVR